LYNFLAIVNANTLYNSPINKYQTTAKWFGREYRAFGGTQWYTLKLLIVLNKW